MAYIRKTKDTWEVQADYGYGEGFECVTGANTRKEAVTHIKEYRENEPGVSLRIKKLREKIEQPN